MQYALTMTFEVGVLVKPTFCQVKFDCNLQLQYFSGSIMARFHKNLQDFCATTTIHGFQYLVDSSLLVIARVLWFLSIAVSFTIAAFLIKQSFDDWFDNPVLTTIESTSAPVEDVPFPGIT